MFYQLLLFVFAIRTIPRFIVHLKVKRVRTVGKKMAANKHLIPPLVTAF